MITITMTLGSEEWHDRMLAIRSLEKNKVKGVNTFLSIEMPQMAEELADFYDQLIQRLHPGDAREIIDNKQRFYELQEN